MTSGERPWLYDTAVRNVAILRLLLPLGINSKALGTKFGAFLSSSFIPCLRRACVAAPFFVPVARAGTYG